MKPELDQKLADLLVKAQAGDLVSYEIFLRETSGVLRAFLLKRMRETQAIEDVLQESLLAIHRARHSYLAGRPVGPWVYAICEHRMLDYFRRFRKMRRLDMALSQEPVVHETPAADTRGERILEALKRLPPRQRQIIELLKLNDLSVKEIAMQLGMQESAVKVTAFRGYAAIRKIFGNGKDEN